MSHKSSSLLLLLESSQKAQAAGLAAAICTLQQQEAEATEQHQAALDKKDAAWSLQEGMEAGKTAKEMLQRKEEAAVKVQGLIQAQAIFEQHRIRIDGAGNTVTGADGDGDGSGSGSGSGGAGVSLGGLGQLLRAQSESLQVEHGEWLFKRLRNRVDPGSPSALGSPGHSGSRKHL